MNIRKIVTVVEEIRTEGGRPVWPAARVAVVAAVIENPWAGQGFVEDLNPGIDANASDLGALLAPQVLEALGSPAEAYGKAAIVGLDGEIEHGSALIHTLKFGDHFRKAAERHHPAARRGEARRPRAPSSTSRSSTSPTRRSARTTRPSRCASPTRPTPARSWSRWPPPRRAGRSSGSLRSPPSSEPAR